MNLSEEFWDYRYKKKETGWDIGFVSTPLKTYIDQLKDKNLKILIPGGGNSYEAEYLHNKGFKNIFVVDLSKKALQNLINRVPSFPLTHLYHQNFFDLEETFDLIIEQTFFCALDPNLRATYAQKMEALLNKNGKLVGVLFNIPLYRNRPPFGGNKEEYINYFQSIFTIKTFEPCYNSIDNRKGNELFIILTKKTTP